MNTFKIIYDNGDYTYTRLNGTLETAKRYFVGHVFNIGTVDDLMVKCVAVEEV